MYFLVPNVRILDTLDQVTVKVHTQNGNVRGVEREIRTMNGLGKAPEAFLDYDSGGL
jgi:hypothetical protein